MAGSVLEKAFSLLLLVSSIQGAAKVELFVYEAMEAEVGQNITIPCFVKDATDQKIVSIKWMKNEGTNLVVYESVYGSYQYWPNVTIQEKRNDENKLIGSYLHLPWVNKWDSGIYICELLKFPSGSFINKTKLTVKDEIKLLCKTDEFVEVHIGDNATIQCTVNSNAQYRWTKNNKFVSDNESLDLWEVTEAHAGTYSLTVDTGDKSLHKDFIISVLTTTTILRTDQDKLMCNTSEAVELYLGDNATIHCTVNSYAHYMWTKAETLVAENESLKLWQVTEAHGGVYKLTVKIGDKSLHKDFIISVLTATTSLRTVSTQDKSDSTQNKRMTLLSSGPSTKHHVLTQDKRDSTQNKPMTLLSSEPSTTFKIQKERIKETSWGHSLFRLIIVSLAFGVAAVILYRTKMMKNRMDISSSVTYTTPNQRVTLTLSTLGADQ